MVVNELGVELSSFLITYFLGLQFGNQYFHVFDSNNKDEKGIISTAGIAGISAKIWIFVITRNDIVSVIMLIV